jgi:hypothetical protein
VEEAKQAAGDPIEDKQGGDRTSEGHGNGAGRRGCGKRRTCREAAAAQAKEAMENLQV